MKHLHPIAQFAAVFLAAAATVIASPKSFTVTVTGSGRPMILIPGLESSGAVWDGVVAHFQSRYRLHVVTLAGFAGQPAVPGLRLSTVRDEIIAYIREQKLDHPVVVGHSLGGFLALWIAAAAPDLPQRVISVDGLPFLPALLSPGATAESSRAGAEQMRTMYSSMKPEPFAAAGRMALAMMISDKKNLDMAAEWAARSDPTFVAQAAYDLMTTDLRDEMKEIRVPVLLIGAGKSVAGDAERLAALQAAYERQVTGIPVHQVVMATGALHFVMLDDPQFLFETMEEFLGKEHGDAR